MSRHALSEEEALRVRTCIIEEIGALMGRRRLTQIALADRLGWTQPYLSRRLTGKTAFSTDDLVAVAETFGIAVTTLFGAEEGTTPTPSR